MVLLVIGLLFHDLFPLQAPSAIRPPVSIGAAKPASQVSNTGIPEPQIVKLEHGGYMAEFEINDLPARFSFFLICSFSTILIENKDICY